MRGKAGSFIKSWWRYLLRGALLVLPTLALLPLGLLWLIERGVVLEWLVAWAVAAFLALIAGSLWRPSLPAFAIGQAGPGAPPTELAARARIKKIAEAATGEDIASAEKAQALLRHVFEQVASAYRPQASQPVLEVTVPELLRVIELTSRNLRGKLLETFPYAQHLTLSTSNTASDLKAWYDRIMPVYRAGRFLVNPINALASEALGAVATLSQRGLVPLMKGRAAQVIVEQAGETAILLYSGRCRTAVVRTKAASEAVSPSQHTEPVRLRVVVMGQVNAGKSSLVNALAGRQALLAAHAMHTDKDYELRLELPGIGPLELIDTPGLQDGAPPPIPKAIGADLILAVVAAHRADRAPDAALFEALRNWSAQNGSRRVPPVIIVATHMDRLDPPNEWAPPYDLKYGTSAKERSGAEALAAIREDIGWSDARCVPVMLRPGPTPAWNLAAVTKCMAELRGEAEQTQLCRARADVRWYDKVVDAVHSGSGAIEVAVGEATRLIKRPSRDSSN